MRAWYFLRNVIYDPYESYRRKVAFGTLLQPRYRKPSREEKENDKGGEERKFVHRHLHLVYSLDSASNKYRIPPPRNYILRQLRNSIHVFENAESNFNSRDLMDKFYLSPVSHFKDYVLRHIPYSNLQFRSYRSLGHVSD